MNKLKLIALLVKNYDAAIQFYTQKLGFKVVEDASFGEDRWVTLSLPNDRGVALGLQLAKNSDDQALVGKQAGSFPLLGLETVDCLGDYNRMKTLGVKFHGEPESGPWGIGVLLEGLYGNEIFTRAQNVRLRLYQQTEGETPVLWFKLQDDGAGYDTTQSNPGMGLANINTRVAEIGGAVLVESAPGHGASLTVRIPMNLPGIDKLERRSNSDLAVGLVIIFFMGLINLEPPHHTGFFLLPAILLILLRLWNEARFLEKMRAINQTITYGDYKRFSVETEKEKLKDPSQSDKTQRP